MNAIAPRSTVSATLDAIGHTRPLTKVLKRLGCDIITAEMEAKDAWAGRNDAYQPPRRSRFDPTMAHNRCRARLRKALHNLRTLINSAKDQTHG